MLKHHFIAFIYSVILSLIPSYSIAGNATTLANNRILIFNALVKQRLLHKDRQLVRLTHVCNLVIDDKPYPVIDFKENIKGPQVARGAPYILVLNESLTLTKRILNSGPTTPLYCQNNQLFLYGYINIDGLVPEGNVLTFSEGGTKVVVSVMEPNDFPVQDTPQ